MNLLKEIGIGITREEVVAVAGNPDDTGGVSRKYRTPSIYKYGAIELHFEKSKEGKLTMAYTEGDDGTGIVLLR